MRIDGKWHVCEDSVLRPVIQAEAMRPDGSWAEIRMLVDVGADRTVLSADVFDDLRTPAISGTQELAGVGGKAQSVALPIHLRLARENGTQVSFKGDLAAFTDPAALDMSVLGRDITNLFAVIIDRPRDVVCLLGRNHRYVIVED